MKPEFELNQVACFVRKGAHPQCSNRLMRYSAPRIKRGKQDHFQGRQPIENHSYSFVDCHILRMAATDIFAGQLLKFCKRWRRIGPKRGRVVAFLKAFTGISCLFTP